ncbi:hypothetical protein PhCBS80983_g01235 [Powellomyces hirtus]|uniref:Mitochondrial carrier domain-containing protein n=1 Tax=Powellomyces hirtus TaxID=109895 RepID=A0A507ECW3_9FUNG|nr:hypothetical protein PhCBS80983_g01235 [Powellomyces hirtus]
MASAITPSLAAPAAVPPAAPPSSPQPPPNATKSDVSTSITLADTGPAPVAGVMAGVAKSVATKSAFAATAMGKGILKWWFRLPVKLFRPHTVSPWMVVNHMAQASGQKVGHAYLRTVVAEEGYGFLGRNIIPLLFANAVAGAVLFNVYASTISALSTSPDDAHSSSSLAAALAFDHHHPFIAGALAGASTALIATPIDNIKANISPADIVAHRHEGMMKFTYRTCQSALKDEKNLWAKCKRLYKGVGFLAAKDACGFGLFFFFFENIRKVGKGVVADVWNLREDAEREPLPPPTPAAVADALPQSPPEQDKPRRSLGLTIANASAVILAGATAGMGYQAVIYPLDNIPAVIAATRAAEITKNPGLAKAVAEASAPIYEDGFHNANAAAGQNRFQWSEVWSVVKQRGIRPFYAGILPQLVRVMPPSALGLFAYEVASSQFWDNDET